MRRIRSLSICPLFVLLIADAASAQKVDEQVVVIHDDVEVKVGNNVVDKVGRVEVLVVREDRKDSIEVSRGRPGSIEKRHLIPLSKAVAHWADEIRKNEKDGGTFIARGKAFLALGQLEEAANDFTRALVINPKSAAAYHNRAIVSANEEQYRFAMRDFAEAIRLSAGSSNAAELSIIYNDRASAWSSQDEHDKAIADYNEAVRLDPKNSTHYTGRGAAWWGKGEYAKALADFRAATPLDPKHGASYDAQALILATCPDDRVRDGKKAIECATKACELDEWKNADHIQTLAAAYAETSDFQAAIKWQMKAVEVAPEEEKDYFRDRIDLYRSGKPYRERLKKP